MRPTNQISWNLTGAWATHASERYPFTIGHPATWTVTQPSHDWNEDTLSMYLAAWSVDVDPTTTLAEWAQAFCDQYVASCTDVERMSEPAFASDGDREGILIAWHDGMVALFPAWYDETGAGSIWEQPAPTGTRIYIVESGRPDILPYRSRELIQKFSMSLSFTR